ncbi:MAG: hypothetical protein AAF479_04415 [Pseudomonadota bacterium]
MRRILIACLLLALIVFGLVEMMILTGMEPVHSALLSSVDLGFPMIETLGALVLLSVLVLRHPYFRRLPIRSKN